MRSPFPGMDPFIEAAGLWEDFHPDLMGEIKRALAAQVPERYAVRLGERPYVVLTDEEGKQERPFQPDVGVTAPGSQPRPTGGTALAETATQAEPDTNPGPVTMQALIATEFRETFVEIYLDEPERYLVTSIEVLSPSNKRKGTPGWEVYLRKRQALLLGQANLVEIDLLRGGTRFPMISPWPEGPYTLLVCWKQRAPSCKVWPAHYRRRLPAIPVPLEAPDADATLDLQPLVEVVYERSRYGRQIDYHRPLPVPLPEGDVAWLAGQLASRTPTA